MTESSAEHIGAKIGDIAVTSLDANASPPEMEQFSTLADSGQRSLEELAASEDIAGWIGVPGSAGISVKVLRVAGTIYVARNQRPICSRLGDPDRPQST